MAVVINHTPTITATLMSKKGGRDMISKKLAIDVLNEALSTGSDYAEIFYEDSHAHNISIENGKVETDRCYHKPSRQG